MTATTFIGHFLGPDVHASRPSATGLPNGTLYVCTTHAKIERVVSGAWADYATLGSTYAGPGSDPIWDAKGDLLAASAADTAARLAVGSNGQVLTADSAQTLGVKWAAATGGMATDAIWDAKGDIAAASAADTGARLAVGSNGQVLTADSAQTLGVKWATAAAGGGAALVPKLRTGSTANTYYIAGQVTATAMSSGASTANHIRAMPFVSPQAITADRIGIANTSGVSGNMRLGIYTDSNVYPSSLLVDSGNISTNATGMLEATISQALTAGTLYWLVYLPSAAPSPRLLSINACSPIVGIDPAFSLASPLVGWDLTVTYGALPNPFTAGAAVIFSSPEAIYLRAA